MLMAAISETDLLDMLAEAIVGGRPRGKGPAEVITGIRGDIRACGTTCSRTAAAAKPPTRAAATSR